MLRLAPPNPKRLGQSRTLKTSYGGAESNVAANLARLGKNTVWFSLLPNNPLDWQCVAEIGQHGVDTSTIGWVDDARMGLYFVEYGQTPRPIRVWYDRANSAASQITQDDLPQQAIQDARWIHLTGITPALSESCRQATLHALNIAREAGKTVSFLPQLEIIPVGGVTLDNTADFIRKGAAAVGVGSSLVNQKLLDAGASPIGNLDELTRRAALFIQEVKKGRTP